jgi:hypothetical protein
MAEYVGRLRKIAGKPPGLCVPRSRFKGALLMASQPKTIESAMEWGAVQAGMPVFIDPELTDDDWYVITKEE